MTYSNVLNSKYYDKVIGIDLGNGLVKIRSVYSTGEPYRRTLPSAFVKKTDIGYAINNDDLEIDMFDIDGQTYGWGIDIVGISEIKYSYGHQGRYKSEPFKLMAKMALALAFKELDIRHNERVLIVTGVPSKETKTIAEDQIKDAFSGVFDLSLNDTPMLFKIDKQDIEVMAQPVATVIGRYLNDRGTVGDHNYEDYKVAVIDIGGGTTDFDIIHALRRQDNYDSIKHGFRDVYDKIRKFIAQTHPDASITDFDLLEAIQEGNATKQYSFQLNKRYEPVDFTVALKNAIYDLIVDIHQVITARWKNQTDLDEILLVGGSATLFKEQIQAVVEGITIPNNNGDSNVEGYFRSGLLLNIQKSEVNA